jgi:hypothetical protein
MESACHLIPAAALLSDRPRARCNRLGLLRSTTALNMPGRPTRLDPTKDRKTL